MTLSLTAVFLPVLFMGGIVGRLLHEFSVTIGVAILVSGFVSISLTPMLCSRFLKSPHAEQHGVVYNTIEKVFDALLAVYDRTLRVTLRFGAVTIAISLAMLVATMYLFMVIPKGFLPSEDQGRFGISIEAAQGIGFDDLVRHQQAVADVIGRDPNILGYTSTVGSGPGGGAVNAGRINVDLKPRSQRKATVDQVIAELRPKLGQIPGVRVYMVNQPPINLGGTQGARSLYQFTLQDSDTKELYEAEPVLEEKMRSLSTIEDVSSDLQLRNPQIQVVMDRDKISALGLNVTQVETALYNAYGTRQVSQI
jgi:HAE1 family hydrophobic/amphiphilic exporter-1